MGDFSLNDAVGSALAAWSAVEYSKQQSRLAQSREQAVAYDLASKSQAAAPQAMPAWLPVAGMVMVGLVVYMVAK